MWILYYVASWSGHWIQGKYWQREIASNHGVILWSVLEGSVIDTATEFVNLEIDANRIGCVR